MDDTWELFDTRKDFSLMNDLAAEEPEKLEEMKALFMKVAKENKVLPIGGGLYASEGELFYEYSALLLKRDKIKVGKLPAGKVKIAFEMRSPLERAAPSELKFWINDKKAASGTVARTVPTVFTASETFDVGRDTSSPVADGYFDQAPFPFEGKLVRLHFENLIDEQPAFKRSPDDD